MNDGDALLAAIIADPDDDTPRLVYADWLEEHGDEDRAEFIRVSIQRTRHTPRDAPEYGELRDRETELLFRNFERWSAPFAPWIWGKRDLVYCRGFVELLKTAAETYAEHADALFSLAPLREIRINVDRRILELANIPRPRHVRLRVGSDVDLLSPAPCAPEPYLLRGSWLILAFAVWSGPDRVAAQRFLQCTQQQVVGPGGVENYGLRPFNDPAEFETWCPVANKWQSPHWLLLLNGKLMEDRVGIDPPPEWHDQWTQG